uniref:Uncharacterized protein n=1 Tax=Meloidogyne enterolobii TaxID=390850 RepID=A0A6V7WQN3_MELEN|nr:unnamed protein product [Meloidogyne enterolobii]
MHYNNNNNKQKKKFFFLQIYNSNVTSKNNFLVVSDQFTAIISLLFLKHRTKSFLKVFFLFINFWHSLILF